MPLLNALSTNTIRVYAIDTTKDHTQCMQLLAQNNIYLIADLSAPNISINRDAPQWNMELYNRYTSVVDTLANFTNVIGFFAGNEVSNNATNVDAIAFVKAAIRDMKSYIKAKNYRPMYVGYASDDDSGIRVDLENYLNCGPTSAVNADFFGYNIYSWCDPSDFATSGYQARTKELSGYSVPAFFAEYGCNTGGTRTWGEVTTLYSSNMTDVWSGGIVYEYFQATNAYGQFAPLESAARQLTFPGLINSISGDPTSATPNTDYSNLAKVIASVSPTVLNSASYSPTNTALRSCPSVGSDWEASNVLPPSPNQQLCGCMVSGLSCVAKSSVSEANIGPLFNYICGAGQGSAGTNCSGISGNGSLGQYGAYSMCDQRARLSWAFNAYYQQQKGANAGNANACDFAGNATTQSASSAGSCAALVSGAGGTAGTGTSTATPGLSTGGGAGGGAAASSGVAGAVTVPNVDLGLLKMGAYVLCAMAAGAGLVLV